MPRVTKALMLYPSTDDRCASCARLTGFESMKSCCMISMNIHPWHVLPCLITILVCFPADPDLWGPNGPSMASESHSPVQVKAAPKPLLRLTYAPIPAPPRLPTTYAPSIDIQESGASAVTKPASCTSPPTMSTHSKENAVVSAKPLTPSIATGSRPRLSCLTSSP